MTLQQIISTKGEPDYVIICDPTHGNESEGVVMIYKSKDGGEKGELIYEDTSISLANIVDITVKNVAIPYIPNDYSLLITTTDKKPPLRIHTGTDAAWAEDVCRQLIACIEKIRV